MLGLSPGSSEERPQGVTLMLNRHGNSKGHLSKEQMHA